MNNWKFTAFHSIALLALLITPLWALLEKDVIRLSSTHQIGVLLMSGSLVLVFEVLILSISLFSQGTMLKLIQVLWTLALVPITAWLLLDYSFLVNLGTHATSDIWSFVSTNFASLAINSISLMTILTTLTLTFSLVVVALLTICIIRSRRLINRNYAMASIMAGNVVIFVLLAAWPLCNGSMTMAFDGTEIDKTSVGWLLSWASFNACPADKTGQSSEENRTQKTTARKCFNYLGNNQIARLFEVNLSSKMTVGEGSVDKKKNVVIVVLESFRYEWLTPYNINMETTPFLKRMADEGLLVEDAFADYPYTSKSIVSIFCGMPPEPVEEVTENDNQGLPYDCLPSLLKPLGYSTAFFQSATETFEGRKALLRNIGFGTLSLQEDLNQSDYIMSTNMGLEEQAMMPNIKSWLDKQKQPFLLGVLTLTGHFPTDKTPKTWKHIKLHDDDRVNSYLNTVRYVDDFVASLYKEFESRNLLDDTIFVFVNDHGNHYDTRKSFSEPLETTTRVPMIIWDSDLGEKGGSRVTGLRQHTDIVPTILEMLGIGISGGKTYGSSLLKPSKNESVHFTCKLRTCLGRIDNDWRFILRPNGEQELYKLHGDSYNDENLIGSISSTQASEWAKEIEVWAEQAILLYRYKCLVPESCHLGGYIKEDFYKGLDCVTVGQMSK